MRYLEVEGGRESLKISVPDEVSVEVAKAAAVGEILSPEDSIRRAIERPIGRKPLRELVGPEHKVAIIANDITRISQEKILLPLMIGELRSGGVAKEKITIVIANGSHRENTPAEIREMYGEEIAANYRVVNHNAYDSAGLVRYGRSSRGIPITINKFVAESDFRIAVGSVRPHRLAGYSGGVKSLSVGVAGIDTIEATHNIEAYEHPGTRLGNITGNLFREFLNEAAGEIGLDYILNVIPSLDQKIAEAVAGDPIQAFEAAVGSARKIYEVTIRNLPDIVITIPKPPGDCDIHQSTKALSPILFGPVPIIRPGSAVILVAGCADGIGHPDIYETLRKPGLPSDIVQYIRNKKMSPGDIVAIKIAQVMEVAKVYLTNSVLKPSLIEEMKFIPKSTVQEALDAEFQGRKNPKLLILPYGSDIVPTTVMNSD